MRKEKLKERIKKWKKAIIVREPMESLASCYNDKILQPGKKNRSNKIKREKLRKEILNKQTKTRPPSSKKAKKLLKNSPIKKKISFNDFLVVKVINGHESGIDYMSKHWAPYYKSCSPCTVGLDYIVRLDPSMEETKVSFLAKQGLLPLMKPNLNFVQTRLGD